jgi:hypothetical protein
MGIEAAMGQADLLHQGRNPDPLRAMDADHAKQIVQTRSPGVRRLAAGRRGT